jgi:hypothetical protein
MSNFFGNPSGNKTSHEKSHPIESYIGMNQGASDHVTITNPASPLQLGRPLALHTAPPTGDDPSSNQVDELPPENTCTTPCAHSLSAPPATSSDGPIVPVVGTDYGRDTIDTRNGVVRDPTFISPTTWDVESMLFGSADFQLWETPIPPHLRLPHGETSIPGLRSPRRSHVDVLAYFEAGWDGSQ